MPTRYLFDTGPEGTTLTTTNTGLTSYFRDSPSTQVFAATAAQHGAFGALFTSTNASSLGRVTVDANNVQALSFWVKTAPDLPTPTVLTLMTVRNNAAAAVGRLGWLSDGTMRFLDASSTYNYFMTAAGGSVKAQFATSSWYRVEALFNGGSTSTGSFTIKIYNAAGTLVGIATNSSANLTASPINIYDIGIGAGTTNAMTIAIDDIQVEAGRTTEIGAYVPSGNNPPAVSASTPTPTTTPNTSVTLNGTATDTDGTISSAGWTWVSVPAGVTQPTITNATTNQATFTPASAGVYVARFTATDNTGATAFANVTIYVGGTSATVVSVTSNSGGWSPQPSTASIESALSDLDASTYAESPASPSTVSPLRLRLGPLQPLTSFSLVLGGMTLTGAGNLTISAELFEGTASRKKWTGLAANGSDITLTLTAAEIATIGNWNTLDIELSVVAS